MLAMFCSPGGVPAVKENLFGVSVGPEVLSVEFSIVVSTFSAVDLA